MRLSAASILFVSLQSQVLASIPSPTQHIPASTSSTCVFLTPLPLLAQPNTALPPLLRRQNGCPAAHTGCSNLGAPQACCSTNAVCTPDAANHVACCPNGASCFGTLGAATTGGGAAAPVTASGATGSVTGGNGVIVSVGTSGTIKSTTIWRSVTGLSLLLGFMSLS